MLNTLPVVLQESFYLGDRIVPVSCDDLIIGGGCSGLSLAIALGTRFKNRKIVVVERRLQYVRDRTWSFWKTAAGHPPTQIYDQWNSWNVGYQNEQVIRRSDLFSYCSIRADHFYESCIQRISQLENVQLILGAHVSSVQVTPDGVFCQACSGSSTRLQISAVRGFDSRLPKVSKSWLKQTFVGKHIHTSSEKFETSKVTRMEFDHAPSCGILFFYVLPYSSTSALVEATAISTKVHSREFFRSKLDEYLARRGIVEYETEYEESGLLPMSANVGNVRPSELTDLIPIGSARGLGRPASGYAFEEIQSWTQAFVSGLNPQGDLERPIPGARPKLVTELDRIFLHQIAKDPLGAPALFMSLFKNTSNEVMPRFLKSQPTVGDLVEVISHLPILPLAKSALETWLDRKEHHK
jgi:lycopene beta-cyclase